MTLNLQGIIIALLVAFLMGILVCYALLRGRLRRQKEALKENQRRLTELERSYEVRLKDTTQQLRHDHEAELQETIEHYQDQLSDRTLELQRTYETRLKVIQQGLVAPTEPPPPAKVSVDPVPDHVEPPLSQPEVLHLKRQYEARLKEAAQKLQHAYEKQLAQHAKTVTADLQTDYEKRLSEKIEHYNEQFNLRKEQLEKEYASRYEALSQAQTVQVSERVQSESSAPPNEANSEDDITVTLQPNTGPASSPANQALPSSQSSTTEMDARLQEATQKIRQEYEQQLSAKLREYQRKFASRMQELEENYRTRLNALTNPKSASKQSSNTKQSSDLDPLDLNDLSQLT